MGWWNKADDNFVRLQLAVHPRIPLGMRLDRRWPCVDRKLVMGGGLGLYSTVFGLGPYVRSGGLAWTNLIFRDHGEHG